MDAAKQVIDNMKIQTQTIHGITTGISKLIGPGAKGRNIAARIKEKFPNVKTVSDSHQPVRIDVTGKDKRGAIPQDHMGCAFALAAKRCLKADGAYIGIETSYLIFKDEAIRFSTPATVAREIPSFDRHEDFANGVYRLSAVRPSRRIGRPRGTNTKLNRPKKKIKQGGFIPQAGTARIRGED